MLSNRVYDNTYIIHTNINQSIQFRCLLRNRNAHQYIFNNTAAQQLNKSLVLIHTEL